METPEIVSAPLTEEQKKLKRREYAREWYRTHKALNKEPVSYDLEYRRTYHKEYYQKNRERLLSHQKELNKKVK
jgi:hypothetical protein